MCFVGVFFCSLIIYDRFLRSRGNWYLESSFTNYLSITELFPVSDNLSWKYKYIKDLQFKGKLNTYDNKSWSQPAKLSISLKRWRLLDKKESEGACKAHSTRLTPACVYFQHIICNARSQHLLTRVTLKNNKD